MGNGDWFVQMFVVSQKKGLSCPFVWLVLATGVYLIHQVTVHRLPVNHISSTNNNSVKYTIYPIFCHKPIKCFGSQVFITVVIAIYGYVLTLVTHWTSVC